MSKLTICRGIPASGKTTWAKSEALQTGAIRISRDDIRHELYGVFWGDPIDENVVTKIQHNRIRDLLSNGFDVIVDDTNLRARNVKRFYELGADEIVFKDFEIELEEAFARDAARARQVGRDVISAMWVKFIHWGKLPPIPEAVVREGGFKPYTQRGEGLPHAIIVDIDGTLAHMNGRGPYDSHLAHTDTLDEIVHGMMIDYTWAGGASYPREVVLLSGRSTDDREVTEDWLHANDVDYAALYMRTSGDKRNDSIVKDELFERHVAPQWNIDYAIDDRDRVVAMWRAKGIKCFQAQPGDF